MTNMAGRLGIDFGASNTVIAAWDEARQEGVPLHIPDFGQSAAMVDSTEGIAQPGLSVMSVIPSMIHYAADGKRWIGAQVIEKGLSCSKGTFSLMKRYIANRSPVSRLIGKRQISYYDAGKDFLSSVLLFSLREPELEKEEVALTVPVEAFEHYSDWLSGVTESAGFSRFRLIDEPSAAALGYGVHVQPGSVYLVFDFGGGTLDVSIVLIEEKDSSDAGRRCRVLGKAGRELGGSSIDGWLMQEVLKRHNRRDTDEAIRPITRKLLDDCRSAKERLSSHEREEVAFEDPENGRLLSAEFTRASFEDLLDQHEMFSQIDGTVRRALNAAHERGYSEDNISAVLMVGGGSLIPSVQKTLERIFGRDLVRLDHPMDAVSRGAAAFVAGVDFYDHIQHDYAIRWVNPQKGDYDYRIIVNRGTPYPSREAVARMTVKASYPGQIELGIAIYEISHRMNRCGGSMELVFDPSGAARLVQLSADEGDRRQHFWINEQSPTFLTANPPAQQGDPRFAVEFGIDANKRLLITARDLKTGTVLFREMPLVKLT